MSLVFQMVSAGNGTTATSTAGSSTTVASTDGTGSLLPFAQALIQKMTGVQDSNNAPVAAGGDPLALLQGLLKQIQPFGDAKEEVTSQNGDLLSELAQDIEKLDDSIANDPSLLASLQGWLLQVSALLTNNVPQDDQTETATVLSPLAQNPETLRFAVQDDLNRLVSIIKDAAAGGNEELTTKGLTVLNNFTEIMSQSSVNTDKAKMAVSQNQQSSDQLLVKSETPVASIQGVNAESGSNDTDLSDVFKTKVIVTADGKKSLTDEEVATEFNVPTESNEIVTAGQLSIRNGMTAPLKAEAPQVPVHQFAKEMTGLITSKLEIVNKGGIAEATISLFPENLGQVDVKITMQNGHLIAQFVTEHVGAKELLEQQMVQLRTALQSQGLQVEKLEVTQNNTPLQSQMQQEGRQSGSGGQSDKRSNNRNDASTDAVTAAELSGEWKDLLESEDPNQTASFSAKA
ncbi:flagellar hook-length control protein FliK [Paenibacillus wynnii]|uniref:flagellar hook-length control protein FliK n=1 Tax=Paenibacillus wynnii TaxID=268407 RepID=UPI00279444B1|nr:flagellar hook-length control protein FliK [Paenibacillus wynnii]MDQ0193489.1 flagellar hook-length control protein FliK [Paenibacillus wynnii]